MSFRKTARQACASVVLLWCLATVPACGVRIDPNATPQQVEQANLRALERTAGVVERVGYFVKGLQDAEIGFHRMGRIPQATHDMVQSYLKITAEFVIDELEAAKDATKTALERRHSVMRALKFIDGLQAGLIDKIVDEGVRERLSTYVASIQILLTAWQLVAGADGVFPLNPVVHSGIVSGKLHWCLHESGDGMSVRVAWIAE
jgi:hypothetical protein